MEMQEWGKCPPVVFLPVIQVLKPKCPYEGKDGSLAHHDLGAWFVHRPELIF